VAGFNCTNSRGKTHHISAIAPLAQLFGVESSVRELTRGRGSCDVQFAGYVPLQAADGDSGGDRDSLVGAPRKPSPTLRVASIALPEPADTDRET
jgi:translation elongation factor EF-G